jgi:hypothetical protein
MAERFVRCSAAVARFGALALLATACGSGECLTPPCPANLAVALTITDSASGAPIPASSVTVSGAQAMQVACGAGCGIGGYAGTYELDVAAPGYRPVHRQVVVTGATSAPRCGCGAGVETQRVTIALPRAAGVNGAAVRPPAGAASRAAI